MIDRTFRGAVIDFIDLEFMKFFIFNVADMFVCIGCGLLILHLILTEVQDARRKRAEKDENGAAS